MKTLTIFTSLMLAFCGDSTKAAQTASTRMYCLSIRFDEATAGGQGALYSLDFTGINAGINGELYPIFDQARSHFAALVLTDEVFDGQIGGSLYLDVPTTDNNGDGFPDIFDTSLAVSDGSSGSYDFPGLASGDATASWGRDAGSQIGSCHLKFKNFGDFYHTFTILEYKGPLTYTPGSNAVSGNVDLALTGASDTLRGPIEFTKSATNAHNELTIEAGAWANDVPQTFSFLSYPLSRDLNLQTNYYSYFQFADWNMDTAEADYFLWVLSIDDVHDADSDGIPDFSDDPQIISVRAPLLSLNRAPTNLFLTISADVGQVCEIQEATNVNAVSWTTISSVTLTNDPQTVSLPLPDTATRFWRVHTP